MDKKVRIGLMVIASAILVGTGIYLGKFYLDSSNSRKNQQEVLDKVKKISDDVDNEGDDLFALSKEAFIALQEEYPNVRSWIAFDDGFVSLPIVQGSDNDYYLTHWIDDSYDEQGAIFYSAYSNLAGDQNITIYGHNVDYDENARFSPLTKLVNQEEYDKHNTFRIYNKIVMRTYVITNVFIYDSVEDRDFDFAQSNLYNWDEFDAYKQFIDERNLIEPIDGLYRDDMFVSIQTCKNSYSQEKIIVIAKLVNIDDYE